jgi:hypothetical protein
VRDTKNLFLILLGFALAVIVLVLGLGIGSDLIAQKIREITPINTHTVTTIKTEKIIAMSRDSVNEAVIYNASFFIEKFTAEMKDPILAERLIVICLEEQVPITIAMATCFIESGYNKNFNRSKALKNNDGTYDQGAMGQNSKSFPGVDPFDLDAHLRDTIKYLRQKYTTYGSWESALIFYNCGSEVRLSIKPVNHMNRVLKKEEELLLLFATYYNQLRGIE